MEEILKNLLVADNEVIVQATKALKQALKTPEAVEQLCNIMVNSPNAEIRQSAAVILRKRFAKPHNWERLNETNKKTIKDLLLKISVAESDPKVRKSIIHVISTISSIECEDNKWPEVLNFINTLCSSDNMHDKELGLYTIATMTEIHIEPYLKHEESFTFLFVKNFEICTDLTSDFIYYTLLTMDYFVPLIEKKHRMYNAYHTLLPCVFKVIEALSKTDAKKCCDVMELPEDLLSHLPAFLTDHIKPMVETYMNLAVTPGIDESVKQKAISMVGWIVKSKKKTVVKLGLIEPVLQMLFSILSQPSDDEDELYFSDDDDSQSSMTAATGCLDTIAVSVSPAKVVPPLLKLCEPALQSENIFHRRAALLTLAILAEGASEYLARNKVIPSALEFIGRGILDNSVIVRNASLFALGQFSEFLQSDVSEHIDKLLPLLLMFLTQLCQTIETGGEEPSNLEKMFYALESFCENLEEKILPYLDELMRHLLALLSFTNTSVALRGQTMEVIGAAATAAKSGIMTYFQTIVEKLQPYLTQTFTDETMELTEKALDTLSCIAYAVEKQFAPYQEESLKLAINLLQTTKDPDLRASCFNLLAALSGVNASNVLQAIPLMETNLMETLTNEQDPGAELTEEQGDLVDVYGDDSGSDSDFDIKSDGGVDGDDASSNGDMLDFNAETAFITEKEAALECVRGMAMHMEANFDGYIEKYFAETFKCCSHAHSDIRTSGINATLQLCVNLYKYRANRNDFYKALEMFIPKLSELIKTDIVMEVASAGLEAYATLLEEAKADVFVGEGHRMAIMNSVIDVLNSRVACQEDDCGDSEGDEGDSEYDELLLSAAGEVIPKFGVAVQPDNFLVYFGNLLPLIMDKQKSDSELKISIFVGILAECIHALGTAHAGSYSQRLMPLFIEYSKNEDSAIKNNAIYGIGELVKYGGESTSAFYPTIFEIFSASLNNDACRNIIDNICGAIAKMIIVNVQLVPMDSVFPVFVNCLPLKNDHEEYTAIFECFHALYQNGYKPLAEYIEKILSVAIEALYKKQCPDDETIELAKSLIARISSDFAPKFNAVVECLSPEVKMAMQNNFVSN